jgi:hypothetical protein
MVKGLISNDFEGRSAPWVYTFYRAKVFPAISIPTDFIRQYLRLIRPRRIEFIFKIYVAMKEARRDKANVNCPWKSTRTWNFLLFLIERSR